MLHYQSAFFAKKKRDNQHITSERGATGLVAISSQTAKWLNMFTVFFAVAVVAAVGILEIPLLNLLVVSVVFLTMALLHFADSWKKRIIHLVLFCAIMIISEALLFILFRLTMANPAQNPLTIAISLAAIRLFLIVLLSRRFGDRSFLQTGPSSLLHHHLILGMVILGYASLMTNIYLLEETNLMPVLLNIVFILILFLLFYFFVDIVQNIDRKEMENQALRLRQKAYSEYYDSLNENEKKIRGFRHDMKNQLIGISALPEEKVKAEIASMIDELDTPSKAIYTQNPIAQLVLATKLASLEIAPENCTIDIDIPDELPMNPAHLAVLVGNNLDNCIEALERLPLEQRKLAIIIEKEREVVIFQFRNTHSGQSNPGFETTKQEKSLHGFGLKSIKAIVDTYDGHLDIVSAEEFRVLISLPLYLTV